VAFIVNFNAFMDRNCEVDGKDVLGFPLLLVLEILHQ
jgi:hypothetical protein